MHSPFKFPTASRITSVSLESLFSILIFFHSCKVFPQISKDPWLLMQLQELAFIGRLTAVVNFNSQLAWGKRYPDIRSNIILSVSVRKFLDEVNV